MIETNIDEIADYLWQRELYIGAHMIRRRQGERGEPEGPQPTSYLAMAMAEPGLGRFGVKPAVVGSGPVPVALPAGGPWAGDVVGIEPPLGFSIEELPALGGASEPVGNGAEVSGAVSGNSEEHDSGQ